MGTRVSTLASVFDSKFGVLWSVATFGVGGGSTRIYGTVKELLQEGRGKQTFYLVKWDSNLVPTHDSARGPNSALIGRRAFTYGQLQRENPLQGKRLTADESNPRDRPKLLAAGEEPDGDDSEPLPEHLPKEAMGFSIDAELTDDEDDPDYEPGNDSAARWLWQPHSDLRKISY